MFVKDREPGKTFALKKSNILFLFYLQCSFLEHRQYKVIYRRYASLYFIIGIDIDDDINELALLEFIHNMVETLDKYFENVCELDVSQSEICILFPRVGESSSALTRGLICLSLDNV